MPRGPEKRPADARISVRAVKLKRTEPFQNFGVVVQAEMTEAAASIAARMTDSADEWLVIRVLSNEARLFLDRTKVIGKYLV
jgi:hypothetical protein